MVPGDSDTLPVHVKMNMLNFQQYFDVMPCWQERRLMTCNSDNSMFNLLMVRVPDKSRLVKDCTSAA